ncbi:MAG: hypothetical protein K2X29_05115 [Candidatus Obscuribacterales bacterium]|nr:hypothetical protein [Candidatus Obscuribacterales bacterium]
MNDTVYVQLLNEGTTVYRPVRPSRIADYIFELGGYEIYKPEYEEWEFLPGSTVVVEEQIRDSEKILVAIKMINPENGVKSSKA